MPALEYALDHATLRACLRDGVHRARRAARPILVSQTSVVDAPDPLVLLLAAQALHQPAFFWQQPQRDLTLVGVGAAAQITTQGHDRFAATAAHWQQVLAGALIDAPTGAGPLLLGGFSFDPDRPRSPLWRAFPDGALILPRLHLRLEAGAALLTINLLVDSTTDVQAAADELVSWYATLSDLPLPTSEPPRGARVAELTGAAAWQALVRHAVETIRRGALTKVVLARAVRLSAAQPLALGRALQRLREHYPGACTFAILRDQHCFLGATPERLVAVRNGIARTTALAGTIRRGATAAEDAALGTQLLGSAKDRHEHALVVETLRAALRAVCDDVHVPDVPELLRLNNVQHLHTPLQGRLRAGHTLLDLLAQLHPTPAVGGLPRAAALRYLREHEALDRGWYAAPVGWLDARGEGEFMVALRSGLISGTQATLFAGCGIVAGSDPAAEYEETRLKLSPMLAALDAVEE
ncbi:isochorismate synthase [Kallotenue papyrolyticum]|uniref:isochorismate synthase n=1 Tax=Kallotenue papyrolyticum TaxID=1325125 RepID=UPI0004926F74|nr:isochorismate synthase [Kallotenue papyrolyticum]